MDSVQTYTIVCLVLNTTAALFMHGKARSPYDFRDTFINLMFCVPIYGRLFGYW